MKYNVALKIKNRDTTISKWIVDLKSDTDLTAGAAKTACAAKVRVLLDEELSDETLEINGTQKDAAYAIQKMDKISYSATIKKK